MDFGWLWCVSVGSIVTNGLLWFRMCVLEDSFINVRRFTWRSSLEKTEFKIFFFFCNNTKLTLEKYPKHWKHFNPIICINLSNIFSVIIVVVFGISILQCRFSLVHWFCYCHLMTSPLSFYFINWLFSNCYFMPLFDSSAFNVPLNWLLHLNDVRENVAEQSFSFWILI